jgi:hypothetical protein
MRGNRRTGLQGAEEMRQAMPVVRLSRGSFDAANVIKVRRRLEEADLVLVPAIQRMRGCLHYWAGVDPISNTMINVSVWASLEDAK